MNIKKIAYFSVLAGTALGLQLFMNCGGSVSTPSGSEKATGNVSPNVSPASASTNVQTNPNNGVVQIGGQCSSTGGNVTVDGDVAAKSQVPCNNGSFQLCTLLSNLGNNQVTVNQGTTSTPLTIFGEHPAVVNPGLQINIITVNSPTSGTATISCTPGSALSATIYGVEQLTQSMKTCPQNGTLTINLGLVANLANTGQRVVYVTQITQSGNVTTVFADVDNVVTAHNCAITFGQAGEYSCSGRVGTVSGTCKGGSLVKIQINDQVQAVVPCKENNTFSADTVVLTLTGTNKVSIWQKTPFNTICTAEKNVNEFGQIQ